MNRLKYGVFNCWNRFGWFTGDYPCEKLAAKKE